MFEDERWELSGLLLLIHLLTALAVNLVVRRRSARAHWMAAALGLVVCAGWARLSFEAPPERAQLEKGPHIVLITLDTFRADHLGALGSQAQTPNLDRVAARGALYNHCTTTAPLTAPAHASMLTGASPLEHGLLGNSGNIRIETVTPKIRARGYRTGAFLSSQVLDRRTGLSVGFDHYEDRWNLLDRIAWLFQLNTIHPRGQVTRTGDRTVARALRWLAEDERPAFLWVHLYDTHSPYLPPAAWRPSEAERRSSAAADRAKRPVGAGVKSFFGAVDSSFTETRKLLYRSAVRFTDKVVGDLVEGLPEDTILIVVGDHGESLDEHGYFFNHGANLYEPSLHVPLIVIWPGRVRANERVERLVSVRQVAATLLLAAGERPDGLTFLDEPAQGEVEDIIAFTPGQQARHPLARDVPSGPKAALRLPHGKLIVQDSSAQWFDLVTDPHELTPQRPPEWLASSTSQLQALLASVASEGEEGSEAWLQEIGYVD